MGRRQPSYYHIRRLNRALTQLRHASRITQLEVTRATGIDNKKLSRMENSQLPGLPELRALLDLYGILTCDYGHYEDIWRSAIEDHWWDRLGLPETPYLSMEYEANLIRDFQTTHLPVLVQTPNYLEQLLATSLYPPSSRRLHTEQAALRHRRRRLDEHPVTAHFLIYEPALLGIVDRPQLAHLLRRSEQDHVTIRILPQQHQPLGISHGSFTLLSFPDSDEPDLAYSQDPIGTRSTQDAPTVTDLQRTFNRLTELALTPSDSCAYLKRRLDQVIVRVDNAPVLVGS